MIAAVFCNALMALLGIGLKVSTLPVVAIASKDMIAASVGSSATIPDATIPAPPDRSTTTASAASAAASSAAATFVTIGHESSGNQLTGQATTRGRNRR